MAEVSKPFAFFSLLFISLWGCFSDYGFPSLFCRVSLELLREVRTTPVASVLYFLWKVRFSLIPVYRFLSLSLRAASVSETLKLRKQIVTEHVVGLSILTSVSISSAIQTVGLFKDCVEIFVSSDWY